MPRRSATRFADRRQARHGAVRSIFRFLKLGIALCLLAVIAAAGWLAYYATTPVEVPATAREVMVKKGRSLQGLSSDLAAAGVLSEPVSFRWMARVLGRAGEIQAGMYRLPDRITPYRLLGMLANGEVAQAQITFIEGWTFTQCRQALDAHPNVRHDTSGLSDNEVLRRIGASHAHPEGLFFPDTYHFSLDASDLQILERAYQTMHVRLAALWQNRSAGLPYGSPYEALIMASIVEKETGLESERDMIAAVFVNRLQRRMRLQTDPTVIYGLGARFDGNLRKRDLETDGPYNTYLRAGLPPTPIAMPGAGALQAALRPADSPALYFVSRGDGSSHFSDDLAEHNEAVRRFQLKR
jgi:UPF0755 protein